MLHLRLFAALPFVMGVLVGMEAPAAAQVKTAAELVKAVNEGQANATVTIAAGTFELTAPLTPKPGMKLKGAGAGNTIIKNAAAWAPGNAGLQSDEGATRTAIQCKSYLINLGENAMDVGIADLTLTGPQMHGAICGFNVTRLEVSGLEIKTFLWAGVRTYGLNDSKIHDNSFFDAGNKSMITTGSSGGQLFLTYTKNSEITNNRFARSQGNDSYGIKGREGRNLHIFSNSIATDFAIEFPFENDHFVEIDHNYIGGTVSIPKYGGGNFPAGGYSFHVHHNYFKSSYSFEYHRNGVEIDHNLFDFSKQADGGNLISGFDSSVATGGTKMHDNLIHIPGRGLYWNEGVYNTFAFYNNHVIAETTVTPRTEGLFDFRPERNGGVTDWKTIVIRDNVFELNGTSRPLMRNAASYAAVIENNTFTNVKDVASYANPSTGKPKGPTAPLMFKLGAYEEWTVNQWVLSKSSDAPIGGAGGNGGIGGNAGAGGTTANTGGSGGLSQGGSGVTNQGGMAGSPNQGGADARHGASGGNAGADEDKSSGSCSVAHTRSRQSAQPWFLCAGLAFAVMARNRRRVRPKTHPFS
ncbi:MAG: hypothetical protein SF187_15830 [Deltaproteobacteria bacterium]|nr:hypothetical protein [Deltaproteobacteria bacterium]